MTQVIDKNGFIADIWADQLIPTLSLYDGESAITLGIDEDPFDLEEHFNTLTLIVIPFASSADGRGFSLAAKLRDLGYTGHLRAQGHILVDQFRMAMRSGFTDVAISDAQAARNPEHQWTSVALNDSYQDRLLSA
ncbi:MAG: DUF934 domain-containing protein [Pseudomonadota bacterium]